MLNCIRTLCEAEDFFIIFFLSPFHAFIINIWTCLITTGISAPQPALSPQSALSPQEFLPNNRLCQPKNFYPTISPVPTGISTPQSALSPQEFLPHNRPYHYRNFYPPTCLITTIGPITTGISTPQSALSPQEFLPHNRPYYHRNFYPIIGPTTTGIPTPQWSTTASSCYTAQIFWMGWGILPHPIQNNCTDV